jgi:hypothetical protein
MENNTVGELRKEVRMTPLFNENFKKKHNHVQTLSKLILVVNLTTYNKRE